MDAESSRGSELAGYTILEALGRGGMGVVYLAEDRALGRKVALKLLSPERSANASFRDRFRREARLAASIDHPNVVPIYEAGEAGGRLYIAMRYVDGTDLRRLLDEEGPLDPALAVELVIQVAHGLAAAHARGLVHRDVKPSNVLIAGTDPLHAYLADFGLTRAAGIGPDADAVTLSGSTHYVAPEQVVDGSSGVRADIYSLGCLLFEALTGSVPFRGASELETLWAHLDEPPPRPTSLRPELTSALDDVVARALAKEADERFPDATAFAAALRQALPPPRRRRPLLLAAAAIAVVIAATASIVAVSDGEPVGDPRVAPTTQPNGPAVQRIDARTGAHVATLRLQGEPVDVAAGGGGVWLADGASRTYGRIDPAANAVAWGAQTAGTPAVISVDAGGAWLGTHGPAGQATLIRVQGRTLETRTRIDLREVAGRSGGPEHAPIAAPAELVVASSSTGAFAGWVLDAAEGAVREVAPTTGGYRAVPLETDGTPLALAASRDRLWVAQEGELLVFTGGRPPARLARRIAVAGTPVAVTAGREAAWVATLQGALVRVTAAGEIVAKVQASDAIDIALANGSLWTLRGDGSLRRLNSVTGRTLSEVDVGPGPIGLAAMPGAIWVAVRGTEPRALPRELEMVGGRWIPVPGGCPGPGTTLGPVVNCRRAMSADMRAADGTTAVFTHAWWERTTDAPQLECDGRRFAGPGLAETTSDAGTGYVRIDDVGTAAIRFERVVSAPKPNRGDVFSVVCTEATGRWIGIGGSLKGRSGAARFTADDARSGRLTLD